MLENLQKCIDELSDCDAFELQLHMDENGQLNGYIPYMMNDALECFFVLTDCKLTGESVTGIFTDASGDSDAFGNFACDKKVSVKLVNEESVHALVIRRATGEVSTLWFKNLSKELHCYRYHEIGHFWVKGQEHFRQLVYIVGTIYDKYSYMGASLCNVEELSLLPLMEFAPFRYWSPIHESLDTHYPDTLDGIVCFKELCMEAGDFSLLRLAKRYEKLACSTCQITEFYRNFALSKLVKKIAFALVSSGHEPFYELIYQKVCEASLKYPSRDYGDAMNAQIVKTKQEVANTLLKKGFVGEYPRFVNRHLSVVVTEEHPFTLSVLEYANYGFRMQYMVSETPLQPAFLNQGFFEGRKNHGWIVKNIDEL